MNLDKPPVGVIRHQPHRDGLDLRVVGIAVFPKLLQEAVGSGDSCSYAPSCVDEVIPEVLRTSSSILRLTRDSRVHMSAPAKEHVTQILDALKFRDLPTLRFPTLESLDSI